MFVTGGTGYLGRPLIEALLSRGHTVRALTREASAAALPPGAVVVTGNALESARWTTQIAPADTFVHLIGTPHPSPSTRGPRPWRRPPPTRHARTGRRW